MAFYFAWKASEVYEVSPVVAVSDRSVKRILLSFIILIMLASLAGVACI